MTPEIKMHISALHRFAARPHIASMELARFIGEIGQGFGNYVVCYCCQGGPKRLCFIG